MIAGIDFSTRAVDIVLLEEDADRAEWHRFELHGQDAFERARNVRVSVPSGSFWDHVLAIGIEEPRGPGNGALLRVQGAILGRLPHGRLVHPLIPSVWRKTVGLPGNAPKWEVSRFVHGLVYAPHYLSLSPFDDWPQDACDAFCIALATRSLVQEVAA